MDNIITPQALKQLLDSLEVNMDETKREALRAHMEATLQERVGLALVELLDDAEVEELVKLTEQGDQAALTAWLGDHVPDYPQVVQDEIDILLGDVAENSNNL